MSYDIWFTNSKIVLKMIIFIWNTDNRKVQTSFSGFHNSVFSLENNWKKKTVTKKCFPFGMLNAIVSCSSCCLKDLAHFANLDLMRINCKLP